MKKSFSLRIPVFLLIMLLSALWASPAHASSPDREKPKVELIAVGDDLLHSQVYNSCKKNGRYDFHPIFKHIKEDVQAADVAVINQETILVDKNYSTYPCFGSPKSVADAIADTGFSVVTHATNHTLDRQVENVLGTLEYWRKNYPNITVLGIHKNRREAGRIQTVTVNGITIAMLNYTYGLNGHKLPKNRSYLIDLLNDKAKVRRDIRAARAVSDFVVVFPHWGTEYIYHANSYQKSWTSLFLEEGVDLVIGTHPHVLQPFTSLRGKDGHRMVVYYSLGNFVSAQSRVPRLLGGMAKVTIVKDRSGAHIRSYAMEPTVTHVEKRPHRRYYTVYKLRDYTEELAAKNYIHKISRREKFSLAILKKLYKKITGKEI